MGESKTSAMGEALKVTVEEFLKHQKPTDLWLCIRGKVIDVTNYQEDHPGSDTILQEMAGKDATTEFDDVGHTPEARSKRDELVIGQIPEEELKTLPGYAPYSEDEGDSEGGGSSIMILIAILVVAAAVAYTQLA